MEYKVKDSSRSVQTQGTRAEAQEEKEKSVSNEKLCERFLLLGLAKASRILSMSVPDETT